VNVELHVQGDVPRTEADKARQQIERLERYLDHPPESARLTVRHEDPGARRPYLADASVRYDGRLVAAHARGESPSKAAKEAAERLRRQLRRIVDSEVAQRNEPTRIVDRGTYSSRPKSVAEAVAEMLDADEEFLPFVDSATGDEVLAYIRDDGRIGLIVPPGSGAAADDEIVVAEASRYSAPLELDEAKREMDERDARFLFFVDAEDGRAKLLYLRRDGDYGLLEPV
jgi:ribosome-associated translation inhibitor RaiA